MTEDGLYARAHKKIVDLIPSLKGETLSREEFWRLCDINPYLESHIKFKKAVNDVLYNLSSVNKKRQIEKHGTKFKIIDDDVVRINFKGSNPSAKVDIIFPFGIHQYCFLYRKNICILFGSKDAGKTALCLNITRLNMDKHKILYFSSEMVDEEFANRLSKCDSLGLDDWNFEAIERSYDFNEVIDPDAVNIIDFLELGGDEQEYYKGVALVRRIYDKLDKGVAIIACQKNRNAEYPKGGSGLLEKARIALSLDPGSIKLEVAKNWADGVTSSPRGKSWTYNLVGGINIINPLESL